MKEKAKQLGLEHVAFDGCSEIWVRDWDDWMAFYSVCLFTLLVWVRADWWW